MDIKETPTDRNVMIHPNTYYMPEMSHEDSRLYLFGYSIEITNQCRHPIQLVKRQWRITNGWGHIELIKGIGVVGQQPTIQPQESFSYESFCPLSTPTGQMEGMYWFRDHEDQHFRVSVPTLYFIRPNERH